jgi:hypothetical protein
LNNDTVSTIQILIFIGLGVSLVVGFVMKMPSARRGRARKLLGQAEWLDDDTADGAYVKISGVVKMRAQGERFLSPLTKNRCVVMKLRAQVRHGRDPRSKLVEDLKIMPFVIEDEDRTYPVEATAAELDVPALKPGKGTDAEKRQVLIDLGHASANPEATEMEEMLVEVGQRVTIAGKLKKADSDPKERLVGDADQPIAVTIDRVRDRDLSAEP